MATKKRNGKTDLTTEILIQIRDEIRGMREDHGRRLGNLEEGLNGVRSEIRSMRSEVDDRLTGLRGEMNGVRTELKALVARDVIATNTRLTQLERDVEDLKRARPAG